MLAFKNVNSDSKEEWSQALTTCRRTIQKLADDLYPPNDKIIMVENLVKINILIACGFSWMNQ